MISTKPSMGLWIGWLTAALIVCLVPGVSLASTFTFRNECLSPVVIQVTSVQKGVLKRDQTLLRPGQATLQTPLDSDKVVSIFCGQTGRLLFRDVLRLSKTSDAYSIKPIPNVPYRVKLIKQPPAPPAVNPPE